MSETERAGWHRDEQRLARIAQRPGARERIDVLRAEMEEADRAQTMSLAMVRKAAHCTQLDLARSMGISQGAVAQAESREDMLLSTLHSYMQAAGVQLRLLVEFPDGRISEFGIAEASAST